MLLWLIRMFRKMTVCMEDKLGNKRPDILCVCGAETKGGGRGMSEQKGRFGRNGGVEVLVTADAVPA